MIASPAEQSSVKPDYIAPLPSPPTRFYDFSNTGVTALRATHCRVLSAELADYVAATVRGKKSTLEELAAQLSTCDSTRGQQGDTGWYYFDEDGDSDKKNDASVFPPEFVAALKAARPGALQVEALPHAWEVFTVTDVRHVVRPTYVGASRQPGQPVAGRMRRRSPKKPIITPRSYFIETLGCQMNASDSERIAASLESAGYKLAESPSAAAVYVLNTCALREHAQQKVYSYLGPHAQRKWDAPAEVTLVVAGCVAQQEGSTLLSDVPELDIVMGPQYANRADEVLAMFEARQAQVVAVDPIHISEDVSVPRRDPGAVTAWINIIYGCLERCTYCVVPATRGLEQSRPMAAVRTEIEAAVRDHGAREVVLLGQNVDAYGRDLSPKVTLSTLLRYIHDVPGLRRIRFTTGHPRYISEGLINTVATLPKVMEHFHIPPQSGDTRVLREMRRGYTRERYISIVRRIRDKLPDASICADMIVGFPGETEEAFENTVSMTRDVVFDSNMVRAYSARPNTQAALRADQVEEPDKKRRLAIMNNLMKEQALWRSRRYLDRVVEVLVEGANEKVPGEMKGRERTNRMVFFEGDPKLVGYIVDVHVDEAFSFSLRGRVVNVHEW